MRAAIHIVIMMMMNSLSVLCVQGAYEGDLGWGCPTDLCISVGKEESMSLSHLTFIWEWTGSRVRFAFLHVGSFLLALRPSVQFPSCKVNILGTAFNKIGK